MRRLTPPIHSSISSLITQVIGNKPMCAGKFSLLFGTFATLSVLWTTPVMGAQKILLSFGPLEFSLSVAALETYAREGKIEPELANYTNLLEPEQLESLQEILVKPAGVSPVAMAQFFYSPQGEIILERVGELIQTKARQNGFYALRSALILAAAEQDGLTLLNVLKKFPTYAIRINSQRGFEIIGELSEVLETTQEAIAAVEKQALVEAISAAPRDFEVLPDLRQSGSLRFSIQSLILVDRQRRRKFEVDLYLPQSQNNTLVPLVIISHGLGSDRRTFAYLAQHLASHGFAVAVPEHPGSNSQQLQNLIAGLTSNVTTPQELVDRPLDIQYLLDELEGSFSEQINLKNVGIIGQSFGAYTALALAGAGINFEDLPADCPSQNSLNVSLLLQCLALQLPPQDYQLWDERIGAAIAINPLDSIIFGKSQLSQIQIPVMLVSHSADTVTPPFAEQILPFSWLTTNNKYLLLLKGATHFSSLAESVPGSGEQVVELPPQLLGPDPLISQSYMQAMGLAFMQTYIAKNQQFQTYLGADYAQSISQTPMPLSLLQKLPQQQLFEREAEN